MKRHLLLLAMIVVAGTLSAKDVRIKSGFDFDWKFTLADDQRSSQADFDDSSWQDVQLPHDWSIKLDFSARAGGSAGFIPGGTGWYRKTFDIPSSYRGKSVSIIFDGVFHQSDVYINGHHLGFHPYGFTSFEYDMTPYLNFGGKNTIAVRVDHSGEGARWYTGSGIYRHAWIQAVEPVHVSSWGTYVTTPAVSEQSAEVKIVTTLQNNSKSPRKVEISHAIVDRQGNRLAVSAKRTLTLGAAGTADTESTLTLANPTLWDIDNPFMYDVITTLRSGGKTVDTYRTPFGVRTFAIDKDKGFFLNGRHLKLQGLCMHMDAGSLGTALPDRAYQRRLEILKEYGCNAIRCSHNPPSPEFLDMCDSLGFIVIDEAFDKWKSGYYQKYFDEWWQTDMNAMLTRDRNHPSIFIWSIGNEVAEQNLTTDEGVERATMLRDFVHKTEPTRPTMIALQAAFQDKFADVPDIAGYNYAEQRLLANRNRFPNRTYVISEAFPYYRGLNPKDVRGYFPENPWGFVKDNEFLMGQFVWAGADYLGESSGWPSKGWPTGLFDLCMFEKPRAAYHRSQWNDTPMVNIAVADQSLDIDPGKDHWQWTNLASHWTFPQYADGRTIEVRTVTNCDSVEVVLNGRNMGKRASADYLSNTIIWYLPYAAGRIEAYGYNGNEKVAEYSLVTSSGADHLTLTPDRATIKADGQDLSHIAVELLDSNGTTEQVDNRKLTVTVEGEGRFLGIDNGEMRREGSFAGNVLPTYFGKALIVVQSTRKAGTINVKVEMEGNDTPYMLQIATE